MTQETGASAPSNEQAAEGAPAVGEQETNEATEQDIQQDAAQEKEPASSEKDGADNESDHDGDDSADDRPKRLSRSERQRRRIRALATELESLKSQLSEKTDQPAGDPPKEEDFNGDFVRYQAALSAHEAAKAVRKEFSDREKKDRETRLNEVRQQAANEFIERAEEFKASAPDFDETVERFAKSGGKFESHVIEELQLSEHGPALVYQLANNPQLAAELNAMSPRDAARMIGRLEAKVPQLKPKTQTKAPKPLTPLSGGAAPQKSADAMSMDEYVKWRANGGGQ